MKTLAIITYTHKMAVHHMQQLKNIFMESVEISLYSMDDNIAMSTIKEDVAVFSTYSLYISIEKKVDRCTQVVILTSTFKNDQYNKLLELPKGEKILVVNNSREMTMETIMIIKSLGINHIELIPYYPEMRTNPEISIAITPGESDYVPEYVSRIIDVGNRVLDYRTLIEISLKLQMPHILQNEALKKMERKLIPGDIGLKKYFNNMHLMESEMNSLLNILEDGIIILDYEGSIRLINSRAEILTGVVKDEVIEQKYWDVLPEFSEDWINENHNVAQNRLIYINKVPISYSIYLIKTSEVKDGYLVVLKEYSREEKRHQELRQQLIMKGYRAKYHFNDIIGDSDCIYELKNIAARMASTNASVMITGETGTGKELFAQSIHNASNRADQPFVAVNCSALPESLLESELFGYEEGAFTGSRKGGKAGLFEIAHKGTLFLDEIGEMDIRVQTRFLRVLEERVVTRIGGDRVIPVDVRIISATNLDLLELMKAGKFRRDLYYRLNVLPLKMVPLRNRKEDIPLLIQHILKKFERTIFFEPEAMEMLVNYYWYGNVRELKNCIQYIIYLQKTLIKKSDVIQFLNGYTSDEVFYANKDENTSNKTGYENEQKVIIDLLNAIKTSEYKNIRVGRRTLTDILSRDYKRITEAQVRRLLNDMALQGLIKMSNGRGGTCLTDMGRRYIQQNS